ncbi:MAG: hypothetical protein PHS60_15300, partial [Zavarzinia sp.]|nr:hypothetical protein [Zavarzinia sp.]
AEILGVLRFEVEAARAGGTGDATISDALDSLGLSGLLGRIEGAAPVAPAPVSAGGNGGEVHFWFEQSLTEADDLLAARFLARMAATAAARADGISPDDRRVIDYGIIRCLGFPAYLGGPFALASHLGMDGIRRLVA